MSKKANKLQHILRNLWKVKKDIYLRPSSVILKQLFRLRKVRLCKAWVMELPSAGLQVSFTSQLPEEFCTQLLSQQTVPCFAVCPLSFFRQIVEQQDEVSFFVPHSWLMRIFFPLPSFPHCWPNVCQHSKSHRNARSVREGSFCTMIFPSWREEGFITILSTSDMPILTAPMQQFLLHKPAALQATRLLGAGAGDSSSEGGIPIPARLCNVRSVMFSQPVRSRWRNLPVPLL